MIFFATAVLFGLSALALVLCLKRGRILRLKLLAAFVCLAVGVVSVLIWVDLPYSLQNPEGVVKTKLVITSTSKASARMTDAEGQVYRLYGIYLAPAFRLAPALSGITYDEPVRVRYLPTTGLVLSINREWQAVYGGSEAIPFQSPGGVNVFSLDGTIIAVFFALLLFLFVLWLWRMWNGEG